MKDIKSMCFSDIEEEFEKYSFPSYRAEQVYKWLSSGAKSFEDMTNIPKSMQEFLSMHYCILGVEIERKLISSIDGTVKYLFRLHDGEFIEAVLMKYHHGYSMCISTQVGCKMGCRFCATGKSGFFRNLEPSEMLAQVQTAQIDNNIRISNIVLMGMGEPLDNYKSVMRFIGLVSDKRGMNLGMRHISLSTCGIVDKIYELSREKLQLTLSVSLHAPNDEIRNQIMPINKKWNVEELMKACKFYVDKTKRRISFEYTMIDGVNDNKMCAEELSSLLRGIICHVNLIPVNETGSSDYRKSRKNKIEEFVKTLRKNGVNVTVRRTLGADINASCGQLRRNRVNEREGLLV